MFYLLLLFNDKLGLEWLARKQNSGSLRELLVLLTNLTYKCQFPHHSCRPL